MGRTRGAATVAILGWLVIGCSTPVPSAAPGSPSPSVAPSPSATMEATIPINVAFRGRVNCNLGFSFYCAPWLSVLEPATSVPDAWRPPETDPIWATRGDQMQDVGGRRWTLLRGEPMTPPGRRLLVISLVGASDMVSYNPDGSIVTELMGRCSTEVDVAPTAASVDIVVRFTATPESTQATCEIETIGG